MRRGDGDSEVPCGSCTACCTSAQFVHIDPSESDTLAHIPEGLLFPAPGLPAGHHVLGYDERGHCPMLRDEGCSIYEHRPRACRVYDCRVFAATQVEIIDPTLANPPNAAIARRVRRWVFDGVDQRDAALRQRVLTEVAELRVEASQRGERHPNPTALALEALNRVDGFH